MNQVTEDDSKNEGASAPSLNVAVAVKVAALVNIADTIDVWAVDLVGNFPQLRETDAYNKFREAVTNLKSRLQAV